MYSGDISEVGQPNANTGMVEVALAGQRAHTVGGIEQLRNGAQQRPAFRHASCPPARSCSSLREIFPVMLRGSSSRMVISLGTL